MTPQSAHNLLSSFFAPATAAQFFDDISGKVSHHHFTQPNAYRKNLLGQDQRSAILNSYSRFKGEVRIIRYSTGSYDEISRPPPDIFTNREKFADAIAQFHSEKLPILILGAAECGPDVVRIQRALEFLAGCPVKTRLFWGPPGSRSGVHRDDSDVLSVQLTGTKEWRISSQEMGFPNIWHEISPGRGGLPACTIKNAEDEPHAQITIREGDLLYIPRGQRHEVRALDDGESISLAFVFRQKTKRDVIAACIDYLSDRDRDMRSSIGCSETLVSDKETSTRCAKAATQILSEAARSCENPDLFNDAMLWKRASFIGSLPALPGNGSRAETLTISSKLRLADLAVCCVSLNGPSAVLSFPGDHLTAPAAFEPTFRFIAEHEEFSLKDLPGRITDNSKILIARKLIEFGVLELAPD